MTRLRVAWEEPELKFSLQICVVDNIAVLHCKGRLTYREEANAFCESIADLIVPGSRVVIDMTELEAVDSAGLGELAVIHMWARAAGCSLKIVGVSDRLRRLFELTNLSSIFEIHSTRDEAIHSLRAEPERAKVASNAA